jgi:hypothetical protein
MAPHHSDGHASVHYCASNGKRHRREMGAAEVERFLSWLVVERRVAAGTQNQALAALLFLYRQVLDDDFTPFLTLQA